MSTAFDNIFSGLSDGSVVPYLGPGALNGVIDPAIGKAIPADSDSLIIAMNNGQPMAPKLMYEFPRAAMNVELKRGRSAVNKFLDATYRDTQWSTLGPARLAGAAEAALPHRRQPRHAIAEAVRHDTAHADRRHRTHVRQGIPLPHLQIRRHRATPPSSRKRSTPACPSCSSRWARRCRNRTTSPRMPTSSITSPS